MATKQLTNTAPFEEAITNVELLSSIQDNMIQYGAAIILDRAVPFADDAMLPVHRAIFQATFEEASKKFRKSAVVVGYTIANFSPHGDNALYQSLKNQVFSAQIPLIEGQGNFGSFADSTFAAQRYTEVKMSQAGLEAFKYSNVFETKPNYDNEREQYKTISPTFPFSIINGLQGIGYGTTAQYPQHNPKEILEFINNYVDLVTSNSEIDEETLDSLLETIAPDFKTGGVITNKRDLLKIYKTGTGSLKIRASYVFNEKTNTIKFTGYPPNTNGKSIIDSITSPENREIFKPLIKDIIDLSDNKEIAIDVLLYSKDELQKTLDLLYSHTPLRGFYNIQFNVIHNGYLTALPVPFLTLIDYFLTSRMQIIKKSLVMDIKKSSEKIHILEGLLKLSKEIIDEVLQAKNKDAAVSLLVERHSFTVNQANYILSLRLEKLTLDNKNQLLSDLVKEKQYLETIDTSDVEVLSKVLSELATTINRYPQARRTLLTDENISGSSKNLVVDDKVLLIGTYRNGNIVAINPNDMNPQKRLGKGKNIDDFKTLVAVNNKDTLLAISNRGYVYKIYAHKIPFSKVLIKNLLSSTLALNEEITSVLSLSQETKPHLLVVTKSLAKLIHTSEITSSKFERMVLTKLKDGDEVVSVQPVDIDDKVLYTNRENKAALVKASVFPIVNRNTYGSMIGNKDSEIVSAITIDADSQGKVLTVFKEGTGKLVNLDDFSEYKTRVASGKNTVSNKFNKTILDVFFISEYDSSVDTKYLVLTTVKNKTIKIDIATIKVSSMNAMGIKLIDLADDDLLDNAAIV